MAIIPTSVKKEDCEVSQARDLFGNLWIQQKNILVTAGRPFTHDALLSVIPFNTAEPQSSSFKIYPRHPAKTNHLTLAPPPPNDISNPMPCAHAWQKNLALSAVANGLLRLNSWQPLP